MIRLALIGGLILFALSADAALLMRSGGGVFGPAPSLGMCMATGTSSTDCMATGTSSTDVGAYQ